MRKAISGAALASAPHSDLAQPETLCMYGNSMLENREISEVSNEFSTILERLGKVCGHNPNVYTSEKSDIAIVP